MFYETYCNSLNFFGVDQWLNVFDRCISEHRWWLNVVAESGHSRALERPTGGPADWMTLLSNGRAMAAEGRPGSLNALSPFPTCFIFHYDFKRAPRTEWRTSATYTDQVDLTFVFKLSIVSPAVSDQWTVFQHLAPTLMQLSQWVTSLEVIYQITRSFLWGHKKDFKLS